MSDDLRADLEAAFAEHSAPANDNIGSPAAGASAVVEGPSGVSAGDVADTPEKPAGGPDNGRARDDHGRFAKKADGSTEISDQKPETTAPEAPSTEGEPIRPPASWSATAKADFATLPAHIQSEIVKRERDIDRGLQERAKELKRYEPLEAVIAPHRDRLAIAGTNEVDFVRNLIAADQALSGPNAAQALQYIAQAYGIPFPTGGASGQGPAPVPGQPIALPPEVQAALAKVSTLEQQLTQREQAEANARRSQVQSEVAAFAADPKHLYYENVKGKMAGLLQAGVATSLEDAYDKACWADPEIRTLIQRDQRAQTEREERERKAKEAAAARHAGGSVIGAPGAGGTPAAANQNSSLRDDIMAAYQEVAGRA